MKPSLAHPGRCVALALALVILTPLSTLLLGQPVKDSSVSHNDAIAQLVQVLNGAYQNSLFHDSARNNLEASDLILEDASIQYSARVLDELRAGGCSADPQESAGDACSLDDPSLALGDWAEMISYAAYRLENAARSGGATDETDNSRALVTERTESMEHLYRMVFALTKAHLDRLQSRTYLDAAQEQLRLARQHLEGERNLCQCDASQYSTRLQGLSALRDQMNAMQGAALP